MLHYIHESRYVDLREHLDDAASSGDGGQVEQVGPVSPALPVRPVERVEPFEPRVAGSADREADADDQVDHDERLPRWTSTGVVPPVPEPSRAELAVFRALRGVRPGAELGIRFWIPWGGLACADVDFFLPDEGVVVEFDSRRFHADRIATDRTKTESLLDFGVSVVRLREVGLPSLAIDHPRYREVRISCVQFPAEIVANLLTAIDGDVDAHVGRVGGTDADGVAPRRLLAA